MVTEPNAAVTTLRAVRGATTVESDDPSLIYDAIRELLDALASLNNIGADDVVSAIFTATSDLHSVFPAAAAREFGWCDVPMLCATEIDVTGAQPRCLRVLLHVERTSAQPRLVPAYLRAAASLRPDLTAPAVPLAL